MIQRIQSVFLFIAAVAMGLMFVFPVAMFYSGDSTARLMVTGLEVSGMPIEINTLLLMCITAVCALAFVISIFLYKNRVFQMRFNAFVFLLNALVVGGIFFYADKVQKIMGVPAHYEQIGTIMPIVSLVMLVLANRAIKKDEIRVRVSDRMR